MKYWFGLGYLYLTCLFYCFTVFYVMLRYIMVSYCFTLRCFTVFVVSTCAGQYEIFGEIRVRNLTCQPVQLNMNNWFGLGYPYLTRLFDCFTVFYVTVRYVVLLFFRHVNLCS